MVDGRKKGWSGRVLLRPFPELGLAAGHRLLPEGDVKDVWQLGHLEVPVTMTFFNAGADRGLNAICPLFSVVGFSVEMVQLDAMHVLDLGVSQLLVAAVIRTLLHGNFSNSTQLQADLRMTAGLKQLNRRLWAFYKANPRPRGEMSAIVKVVASRLFKLCPI